MKSFQSFLLVLALASAALFLGCKKDSDSPSNGASTVNLEFENQVNGVDLKLDTLAYMTPAGDWYSVSKFKYIISNIKLTKTDGSTYAVPNGYFLVDQAKDESQNFQLTGIPTGDYNKVSFIVGVDSTRSVAGAGQGALSSDNDMYWSWNTGFIFMKLEGNSPQVAAPAGVNGAIVFHVGGFKTPNNCLRTVTMPLPENMLVRTDHHPEIHILADVEKMFRGVNTIRFGSVSNVMGGANAVKIADNYANPLGGMFLVEHIHAN